MKPEASLPQSSPEFSSVQYGPMLEHAPVLGTPEAGVEKTAERYEQKAEASAIVADVGLMTVIPAPVKQDDKVATITTKDDNPAIAKDDDLIEKEWVNRAKKIVADTRDNPYQRDASISQLQRDYIKKRFGRELGAAE